jgi:hypothetical protein
MAYEWARFAYWCKENGNAVQVLASIFALLISCITLAVTVLYVRLTRKLSWASTAALEPLVGVTVTATPTTPTQVLVVAVNEGQFPLRIISMVVNIPGGSSTRFEEVENSILPVGWETSHFITPKVPPDSRDLVNDRPSWLTDIEVIVEVTDLKSRIIKRYTYSGWKGLRDICLRDIS